jgi:hypothetical protein
VASEVGFGEVRRRRLQLSQRALDVCLRRPPHPLPQAGQLRVEEALQVGGGLQGGLAGLRLCLALQYSHRCVKVLLHSCQQLANGLQAGRVGWTEEEGGG